MHLSDCSAFVHVPVVCLCACACGTLWSAEDRAAAGGGGGGGGRDGLYLRGCFINSHLRASTVFGLAVRRSAGKRKDLGSIPLRLSFLFKKVVVCGHCLVTLSITSY